MAIYPDVLALVGNTPIVALSRIGKGLPARLTAKLEMFNPGGSVKDRICEAMIVAAERAGHLKPGGVIVEPTGGNTGIGLAISALWRGYHCVFVIPDRVSQEKRNLLNSFGAEVVVCPTNVPADSPDSYYSVANRLEERIPGAVQLNQYRNQANPQAHYENTGPEIWEQTEGKIAAFVAGVGTGGTISGVGQYLKEQNPEVLVVGVDPEGSIYTEQDNMHAYLIEGIGEDFWPETFNPKIVDRWEQVSDKEAFAMARRLAREEGLLVGGSSGSAVVGAMRVAAELPEGALVMALLPDSGRSYLSKIYNDGWMAECGFLERPLVETHLADVLQEDRIRTSVPSHIHPNGHAQFKDDQAHSLLKVIGC